jgi:uncharacterized membrane protein YdbT with pleckstrin-like domain
MSYVEKHLISGENVVYETKLNWTEYLRGLILVLIGLFLIKSIAFIGYLTIVLGIISLILSYLRINYSEFAVTNKRVLIKVGVIKTKSLETMLNKVEGIHVDQGLIGKFVNSGTIVVKGTGGTNNPFKNIDKPFEFRNAVNEQTSKTTN